MRENWRMNAHSAGAAENEMLIFTHWGFEQQLSHNLRI
jgi:hypothetical protein